MKNLSIKLPLVDGSVFPMDFDNGKELIDTMCSDDISPKPISLVLEVQVNNKKKITINIPYGQNAHEAFVSIEDN